MRSFFQSLLSNRFLRYIVYVFFIYLGIYFLFSRLSRGSSNKFFSKLDSTLFKPLSSFRREDDAREFGVEQGAVSISAMKVDEKSISPNIDISGLIDFTEKVDLYSKIGGRLEKIFVKEGEEVSQGQKLFKVESLQMELELMKQQATLESSRSQVKLAKEKYDKARMGVYAKIQEMEKSRAVFEKTKEELEKARNTFLGIEEIYKAGGMSREEFETAKLNLTAKETSFGISKRDLEIHSINLTDEDIIKNGFVVPKSREDKLELFKEINTQIEKAELEVADGVFRSHEAQVNSTKTMLKETIIFSPIKGVVAKRYKNEGELLTGTSGNQAVLTVINIDKVYGVLNISETDSTVLKKGMKVEFTADVYKESKFRGQVETVSPLVDQKAHTVEVRALVDNKDRRLKPGMFIRANVVLGSPVPTILIPSTAVLSNDSGRNSVFLVREGHCYTNDVKIGKKQGDEIEILQGLQKDDVILLDRLSQLRDGMAVSPSFVR
ncbi:efflux RND transporter periplasmic adaptor subunit [Leptospira fletcheri]|uniref:Efflux RND transporter periplasmic adaptor subunit n=1 Tax=Leptospira fletcheri TaxID=2484981 RepID=A0A4R9GIT1_9LEPT|nr:efflux RND transporter periplasmic adaptor subunit [Leptospira fletcheri]